MTIDLPIWLLGTLFSLGAGLLTAIGALPVFFVNTISEKWQDICLGFGAGVMLAATSFSLIVPALEAGSEVSYTPFVVIFGILLGGLFLHVLDDIIPHEHFIKGPEGISSVLIKKMWLFVLAITIHNFPEGIAVGVSFGNGDIANGMSLALGIGLQNMPEGLVVALALLANGYSRKTSFLVALFSGLIEPIGGLWELDLLASLLHCYHFLLRLLLVLCCLS